MISIFISHSSKNKNFALKVSNDLVKRGYSCWLDEWKISVGDSIISKIQEGINESDYLILILSKHSVQSKWVENEWKSKYWEEANEGQKIILPILLEDCDIPTLLKEKKYADFRNNYIYGLNQLLNVFKKKQFYKNEGLFIWQRDENFNFLDIRDNKCHYCKTELLQINTGYPGSYSKIPKCPLCGWHEIDDCHTDWGGYFDGHFINTVLKYFDFKESVIPYNELASYLNKNNDKIYDISWQNFENMIRGIYRDMGYEIVLSQITDNGKSDIIMLSNNGETTLIHCEKNIKTRKVELSSLRNLLGASVDLQLNKSTLITNTDYSDEVKFKTKNLDKRGFEIDLVAGSEIIEFLGAYNKKLPPIKYLNEKDLEEIIFNSKRN